MSRITRQQGANGIDGANWFPYLDGDGRLVLGRGESEDAKTTEGRTTVSTEAEAIDLLRTGEYWIRMTAHGTTQKNLISPGSILIDGQPIA